MGTMFVATKLF